MNDYNKIAEMATGALKRWSTPSDSPTPKKDGMNERIFELAKQAVIETNLTGVYIPEEFSQKFALLIIRRCAQAANDWYQNHEQLHWDPATHVLAEFGVEE